MRLCFRITFDFLYICQLSIGQTSFNGTLTFLHNLCVGHCYRCTSLVVLQRLPSCIVALNSISWFLVHQLFNHVNTVSYRKKIIKMFSRLSVSIAKQAAGKNFSTSSQVNPNFINSYGKSEKDNVLTIVEFDMLLLL